MGDFDYRGALSTPGGRHDDAVARAFLHEAEDGLLVAAGRRWSAHGCLHVSIGAFGKGRAVKRVEPNQSIPLCVLSACSFDHGRRYVVQ